MVLHEGRPDYLSKNASPVFYSTRLVRRYETRQVLEASAWSRPSKGAGYPFLVDLEVANTATYAGVQICQVTTISPNWTSTLLTDETLYANQKLLSVHRLMIL